VSGKNHKEESGRIASESHDAAVTASQAYAMAGAIAHDLNTILTTIYGYSETALETLDETSEAGRNIRRIIAAADRAKSLTSQLLDLSRRSAHNKAPLKVSDVLSEALDFLQPSAGSNIKVTRQIKTPGILVEAVPEQLFRVFLNIAANALDSMEDTGGSLTVTLDTAGISEGTEAGANRRQVLIRFADTGKGMDAETSARMFEPFFTSGKREKGTGLGLTIAHDIVTEMNGSLRVNSEKGRGTVIDLLFPAAEFGSLPEKPYLRNPEK